MIFSDWYKKEYGNDWFKDSAQVGNFRDIVRDEYLEYCAKNNIKPKFI